ncbi:MAG: hypothetical protein LC732_04295, partial [Acidobacteria bacterium]|nr:hypothetical protein [Acidobacteriota bacterium]
IGIRRGSRQARSQKPEARRKGEARRRKLEARRRIRSKTERQPGVFASLDTPATFWHRSAVRILPARTHAFRTPSAFALALALDLDFSSGFWLSTSSFAFSSGFWLLASGFPSYMRAPL